MTRVAIKISLGTGLRLLGNTIEALTIVWIGEGKSPLKNHVIGLKEWFKVENCVVLILDLMPNTLKNRRGSQPAQGITLHVNRWSTSCL